MASAKFKHAVKRIKDKLGADYTPTEATPTAGPVGSGKLFIGGQVFDGDISGVTQVVNVGRPAAAQYAAKVGGGVTVAAAVARPLARAVVGRLSLRHSSLLTLMRY